MTTIASNKNEVNQVYFVQFPEEGNSLTNASSSCFLNKGQPKTPGKMVKLDQPKGASKT